MTPRRRPRALRRALLVLALPVVAACASVPPPSRPAVVGARALVVDDAARARRIEVEVFHPTTPGTPDALEVHAFIYAHRVARGAPMAPGRHPIVVLSHGTGGTPWDLFTFARAFVDDGFVALSIRHPGDTYGDYDVLRALEPWQRPQDVTSVLDAVLADPALGPSLDPSRVVVVGHSAGGFTALGSVGARYSIANAVAKCTVTFGDPTCDGVRPIDRSTIDYSRSGDDYRDPRVDVVVALAPAVGEAADPVSAGTITRPVLIVGVEDDALALFPGHARHWATMIPTATLEARPTGGHYQFIGPCAPWGALFADACADAPGFDRASALAQHTAFVRGFVRAHLPP